MFLNAKQGSWAFVTNQVQVYSSPNFLNVQQYELHTALLLPSFYPCSYMPYINEKQTNPNPNQLPSPPGLAIVPSYKKQSSSAKNAYIPLVICFSQDLLSTQHP